MPGPRRFSSIPAVSIPACSAVARRPALDASGIIGLASSTMSGALLSLTAVVSWLKRSDWGALERTIVEPEGAHDLTSASHGEPASRCGYGSQNVICAVVAPLDAAQITF